MNFSSLKNQTVTEAKASDHEPIVLDEICTFNLLCRCKVNKQFANNGFLQNESAQEYQDRLIYQLLPVILELTLRYEITLFAFQEAPPIVLNAPPVQSKAINGIATLFYSHLSNSLPEYVISPTLYKSMWEGDCASGLLMIYHKQYDVKQDFTPTIVNSISGQNKSRFQAVKFYHKRHTHLPSLNIVNFHADFNNQEGTNEDILTFLEQDFIVAGDFNLKAAPHLKNCVKKIHSTIPGLMPCDTFDGIFKKIKS